MLEGARWRSKLVRDDSYGGVTGVSPVQPGGDAPALRQQSLRRVRLYANGINLGSTIGANPLLVVCPSTSGDDPAPGAAIRHATTANRRLHDRFRYP